MSPRSARNRPWPSAAQLLAALPRWLAADLKGREDRLLARAARLATGADALVIEVDSLASPGLWRPRARAGRAAARLSAELAATDPRLLATVILTEPEILRREAKMHAPLDALLARCAKQSLSRLPLRCPELGDRVLFLIDAAPPELADTEALILAAEALLREAAMQRAQQRLAAENTLLRRENLVLTEERVALQSESNHRRALLNLVRRIERAEPTAEELLRVAGQCLAAPLDLSILLLLRPAKGELLALIPPGQPDLPTAALIRSALMRHRLEVPEETRTHVVRDGALHELVGAELYGMATALSDAQQAGDRLVAISLRRAHFAPGEQAFLQRGAELLLHRLDTAERDQQRATHTHFLEGRLEQLSASYRIARALSDSADDRVAAARILRDVRQTFGAEAAVLVQAEGESDRLSLFSSIDGEAESVLAFALTSYEARFGSAVVGRCRVTTVDAQGECVERRELELPRGPLDATRWPNAIVAPLRLPDGQPGILCLCSSKPDAFTAETETALRVLAGDAAETLGHLHGRAVRERKMLEELVAHLPTAVIVIGADRSIRVLNRAARSLLGLGQSTVRRLSDLEKRLGLSLSLLLPDDSAISQSTQDVIWGEEGARHLRIDIGSIAGGEHVLVLRDVTRRKRLELEQAEFVGSVSHELKTPLTALRTALEIILQGEAGIVSEEQAHFLEMGRRNIDRLSRLIQQLLDVARHESGRLELSRSRVDLAELLVPHLDSFARHARRERRELSWQVPATAMAHVDADRFVEILENLLGNALKFTEPGGHIRVALRAAEDCPDARVLRLARALGAPARGCVLEVADDGRGMEPAAAERAFQRFYQEGDPLAGRPAGAGLGLAITRALVAAHEGAVQLESEKGKGTTVRVWVPEDPASAAASATVERLGHAVRELAARLRRGRLVSLRERGPAAELERVWKAQGLDPARLGASIAGTRFALLLDDEWRAPLRRALATVADLGADLSFPQRGGELGTLLAQLLPQDAASQVAP